MASTYLQTIRKIYDDRAPHYDHEGSFHTQQAQDYLKWMSLQPGQNVLDLACGTGAITVPAALAILPHGKAFGVDVSSKSLDIARAKAEKAGVDVQWIECDIEALEDRDFGEYGDEEGWFDVISCASAFMLVQNPVAAVKSWAKLLKSGGRIIIDVPTGDSTLPALLREKVAKRMGIEVIYERDRLGSMERLCQPMIDAGLEVEESFVADHYAEPKILRVENAGEIFDESLSKSISHLSESISKSLWFMMFELFFAFSTISFKLHEELFFIHDR